MQLVNFTSVVVRSVVSVARDWAGGNWQNWQNLAIFRLRHIAQNPDKIYYKFVHFAVDFWAGIWYTYTILERVNNIFKGDFQ